VGEQIAAAQAPQARAARGRTLREWLGNPLIVAVATTILASLVIPQLTRQWQDHQKALEIQTALVSSMSESVSDALVSGRMIASGVFPAGGSQKAYNAAVRSWSIESSVTGAKLEAYFPGTGVGDDWRSYGNAVTNYLLLTGKVDGYRSSVVAGLRGYRELPGTRPPINWRALEAQNAGVAFQRSYVLLGFALLDRRDTLVKRVLGEHPSGF
jgi:hypothetical protein